MADGPCHVGGVGRSQAGFYLDRLPTMPRDALSINLFTAGDSGDPSTWSNVPYFLSKALVEHGVDVRRINLIPYGSGLFRLYRAACWKYDGLSKRLFGKRREMDLFHDRGARALIRREIRRACKAHRGADFNFFLTYSFSSLGHDKTPTVHFSDVCMQHALEDRGLAITPRHRKLIEEEKASLSRAGLVLGTNEPCCVFIREHYGVAGVQRLPGGINLDWEAPEGLDAYLDRKQEARRVLFIGIGVHKRGADILLQAFERFNQGRAEPFVLTLVGVSEEEIGPLPRGVECIAYLNKNDPGELARYTALLESAMMFVMPMREGPPPGVTKEALLTGTPVILSNIWHADSKVQHDRCGRLVDQIEPGAFAEEMALLADDPDRWRAMAKQAMVFAEQWSWASSIGGLVDDLYRLRDGGVH